MPINPKTVKRGEVLNFHQNRVKVLAVNRFWTPGGKLIAGAIMLDGDPMAQTPRSLETFCNQAKRPRR